MIRSVMSIFGASKPVAPVSSTSVAAPPPQLLSKKRKSTDNPHPHDEDQTMEYSAMLKPKLLSTLNSHTSSSSLSTSFSIDPSDSENNSLLSNRPSQPLPVRTTSSALMNALKSTNAAIPIIPTTLMKKPTNGNNNTANANANVTNLQTQPQPLPQPHQPSSKEESPPKKAKLNSGVALPIAAPPKQLPPMPSSVSNMLSMFQLELDSRIERLRSTSSFQISSLTRSFKNELNKVPSKVRSLTLREFLQSGFEGDASAVMTEQAMVSQNKLESWVAATPKLRTSRKHREMLLATPGHSALLATTQRLTRASARKLYPNALTGLGIGLAENGATSHGAASSEESQPKIPTLNLADAVYETPSLKGGKTKSRMVGAAAAVAAAPTATATTASISIASLMATAARSARKKLAPSTARQASIDGLAEPIDAAATTKETVKETKKRAATSRRAASPSTNASAAVTLAPPAATVSGSASGDELDSANTSSTSTNISDAIDEDYEPAPAPVKKTRGKKATTTTTTKAKTTRGKKAAAAAAPVDDDAKCDSDAMEVDPPVVAAPPKKKAGRPTKKSKDLDAEAAAAAEPDAAAATGEEQATPAPAAAAPPKRVTRARAKKGEE